MWVLLLNSRHSLHSWPQQLDSSEALAMPSTKPWAEWAAPWAAPCLVWERRLAERLRAWDRLWAVRRRDWVIRPREWASQLGVLSEVLGRVRTRILPRRINYLFPRWSAWKIVVSLWLGCGFPCLGIGMNQDDIQDSNLTEISADSVVYEIETVCQ